MCPVFVWVLCTASCQNVALCQTSAQFPLCLWPAAFQNKRWNFCPVTRGAWNFILAVTYEIGTRCGHSAHMLCYSFPDRLTKWVFSDAFSCSDDMERGDLHYRFLQFMAKSKIRYKSVISHQLALQNSHFPVPKPPKVWSVRRRWWKYSDIKCNK